MGGQVILRYHMSRKVFISPSHSIDSLGWCGRKMVVAQLCLTVCDPMDCSPPGSSVHGILQVRILEWVAILFSRGSSRPRDQTQSPALQAASLPPEPAGEPQVGMDVRQNKKDTGFPGGSVAERPPDNAGDTGSIPDLGRCHVPRSR